MSWRDSYREWLDLCAEAFRAASEVVDRETLESRWLALWTLLWLRSQPEAPPVDELAAAGAEWVNAILFAYSYVLVQDFGPGGGVLLRREPDGEHRRCFGARADIAGLWARGVRVTGPAVPG